MIQLITITHDMDEEDTREKSFKTPTTHDTTKIAKFLKENWGELVNYDKKEKTVYLCDNSIMGDPKFVELLKTWKLFIQPSLF